MAAVLPFRRKPDFEALVRPHADYLYRLAWRFTGNAADAEDLLQDVFMKLFPRTRELAAVEALRPWLARVLYRQFVDLVRRRARSPLVQAAEDDDEGAFAHVPAAEGDPQTLSERRQGEERVAHALARLNPEQRAVVALHDIEGYTLEELERMLETPLGTLKSRLHRARRRLRVLLSMEPFPGAERVRAKEPTC